VRPAKRVRSRSAGGGHSDRDVSGYFQDEASPAGSGTNGFYSRDSLSRRRRAFLVCRETDDCFKSSGYRIGPFEVESALLEHHAVLEWPRDGVPDPQRGLACQGDDRPGEGFRPSDASWPSNCRSTSKATAPYKYPRSSICPRSPQDDQRKDPARRDQIGR